MGRSFSTATKSRERKCHQVSEQSGFAGLEYSRLYSASSCFRLCSSFHFCISCICSQRNIETSHPCDERRIVRCPQAPSLEPQVQVRGNSQQSSFQHKRRAELGSGRPGTGPLHKPTIPLFSAGKVTLASVFERFANFVSCCKDSRCGGTHLRLLVGGVVVRLWRRRAGVGGGGVIGCVRGGGRRHRLRDVCGENVKLRKEWRL